MFVASEPTPLEGLLLLRRRAHTDDRGKFERLYCQESLTDLLGVDAGCLQVNYSVSRVRGTLRGLHLQRSPDAETKVVSCLAGALYDVAVDMRTPSPTFLRWYGVRLDQGTPVSLYVPPGFAHGFVTLAADTTVLYASSAQWSPASEEGIRYDDPTVGIEWPEPVTVASAKYRSWPLLESREDLNPRRNTSSS